MPKLHPWMTCYAPEAASGFSGGPVIKLDASGARLWAIHTHSYSAQISGNLEGGESFSLGLKFGGAVPVRLLMQAIDQAAGKSEQIIDLLI